MSDLISREALKKACSEMVRGSNNSDFIPCPSWNNAMELIDNAPTVERPIGEWIPVSERLPKEETDVLICNKDGEMEVSRGSYSTELEGEFIWYTSGWIFGKVIAWQPLPEPYKEQNNGT